LPPLKNNVIPSAAEESLIFINAASPADDKKHPSPQKKIEEDVYRRGGEHTSAAAFGG
jgi:hypothetical protein